MNNKKRGAFLRKAREAKKLTQEELGNLIFYSDKTISAWEKGIYTPSDYDTIIKLSQVLDISPLSILYGEDDTTEEEQIFSFLNYRKQTTLKLIIITIIFLLTLVTIFVFFYLTNLRDTTSIYSLVTDSEDIIFKDSFYLRSKGTSIISLNKIIAVDNMYTIKNIELYYIEHNKKIKIVSGPNEDYYIENNNIVDEYNIKDLFKKTLYLNIITNDNKNIKINIILKKRQHLFSSKEALDEITADKKMILKDIGFIYQEGEYVFNKDKITIRYNEVGTLHIIKENKDNNEYLYKKVNYTNIMYKKIYNTGEYIEKELKITDKSDCNLENKKDITKLAECLNYLSEELKE